MRHGTLKARDQVNHACVAVLASLVVLFDISPGLGLKTSTPQVMKTQVTMAFASSRHPIADSRNCTRGISLLHHTVPAGPLFHTDLEDDTPRTSIRNEYNYPDNHR